MNRWALPAIIAAAVAVRVVPQLVWGGGVNFVADSCEHMILVDQQIAQGWLPTFPATWSEYRPLLTWLIAYPAMLAGGSRGVVDVVGAITPVIIGAATVFVVYKLARQFQCGSWSYAAAAFVALWPSEAWQRSTLALSDHHSLEILFSTMIVLFAARRNWWALGLSVAGYGLSWQGVDLTHWLRWFAREGKTVAVAEEQPTLFGQFVLGYGVVGIPLALYGLYAAIRGRLLKWPWLVWLPLFLGAAIWQERWNYYLAVPVAVFAALGLRRWCDAMKSGKGAVILACVASVVVGWATCFVIGAKTSLYTPDWHSAMAELRTLPARSLVLCQWDFGPWVVRDGGQVAVASTSRGPKDVTENYLRAETPEAAEYAIRHYSVVRYVVVSTGTVGAQAARLWSSPVDGYRLMWESQTVKVFERGKE